MALKCTEGFSGVNANKFNFILTSGLLPSAIIIVLSVSIGCFSVTAQRAIAEGDDLILN